MAKRTKRKNNKLSKRKYSRHRVNKKKLSRRRVTKKENNRKRKHINKKLLMGGSLSTSPPDVWGIRAIFTIEKNKYLKKNTIKLVYILANNRDQTYPLKLYFAENKQSPDIRVPGLCYGRVHSWTVFLKAMWKNILSKIFFLLKIRWSVPPRTLHPFIEKYKERDTESLVIECKKVNVQFAVKCVKEYSGIFLILNFDFVW